MPTETTTSPSSASDPAVHAPKSGPRKLAVIDLEGSGLRLKSGREDESDASYAAYPHRPGVDHACILEAGIVILDAATLQEEARDSWLVLPPGVDTLVKFDAWMEALRTADPFVFEMHSKKPTPPAVGAWENYSLLDMLRDAAIAMQEGGFGYVSGLDYCRVNVPHFLHGARYDHKLPGRAPQVWCPIDLDTVHPGNSDVMFVGNSIANYDIPMLRRWMPDVVKALSYRIMDVSVLRSFYNTIAAVELPEGLDLAIRAGGNADHRALGDAEFCAEALRRLASYARNADASGHVLRERARASAVMESMNHEVTPDGRVAHLEMLVRYGSKRAINEEREYITRRDGVANASAGANPYAGSSYGPIGADTETDGLFRKAGGILRAKPEDVADDFTNGGAL